MQEQREFTQQELVQQSPSNLQEKYRSLSEAIMSDTVPEN